MKEVPNSPRLSTVPLKVHPVNPRYFADSIGRPVFLTGSHTWCCIQDMGETDPPPAFDYPALLDHVTKHGHNFMRLWMYEHARWASWTTGDHFIAPLPFARTGPGVARDGKPKFDLRCFNEEYFERLKQRVAEAGRRGLYVSVMLFQGWSHSIWPHEGKPWPGHPFHRDNNINGIDGDLNGDGEAAKEFHTLANPAVTVIQEAYVKKAIDALNDQSHLLWEICNEDHRESREWQYHMIRLIKAYEANLPLQHPVGMTGYYCYKTELDNSDFFDSPADWISPIHCPKDDYKKDPPAADGRKVILIDTDHIWGVGGDRVWVWKSFTRGLQPIFMDPMNDARWESARKAMGQARAYADRMDLVAVTPQNAVASTHYCLAQEAVEYLVYQPDAGEFTVSLKAGAYDFEWFNPGKGEVSGAGRIAVTDGDHAFTPPFEGDAVLYLKSIAPV